METILNWIPFVGSGLQIETNPLVLINHLLQAYFFSAGLGGLVALMLNIVNFAYAQEVASSKVTKIVGVVLFYYLKIWDYYSGLFYILSIFSLFILSLYVYDCCGNISEYFDNWRQQNRDLAIIFSFLGMFVTTFFIIWMIYKNTAKPLQYEYSGIYLLQIVLIIVGNLLRRRSVLYALMGVLTINYLIAARYYLHADSKKKGYAQMAKLPIEYLLYFLMALDAQKRERNAIKSNTYGTLFKVCTNLAAFSILNQRQFPLELILGVIFIFCLIINR